MAQGESDMDAIEIDSAFGICERNFNSVKHTESDIREERTTGVDQVTGLPYLFPSRSRTNCALCPLAFKLSTARPVTFKMSVETIVSFGLLPSDKIRVA